MSPTASAPPPIGDSVAEYTPCARPGHRAPHLWLDDAKAHSTLDLFGRELVLLTPVPDRWQAAAYRTLVSGIPLRLRPLPTTDTRQVYGVAQSGAVLVRPDGYVAARWPAAPDAIPTALQAVVGTVLSRRAKRSALSHHHRPAGRTSAAS